MAAAAAQVVSISTARQPRTNSSYMLARVVDPAEVVTWSRSHGHAGAGRCAGCGGSYGMCTYVYAASLASSLQARRDMREAAESALSPSPAYRYGT